jgi:hypothetical protein
MKIEELKKIAQETPLKKVTVFRKYTDAKTGREKLDTITPIAKIAYRNLSKPYEERVSGWKRCYLEQSETLIPQPTSFRLDTNSLSNPDLIQKLQEAGFVKMDAAKSLENAVVEPSKEKSLSDFSEDEIKAYLKAKKAESKKEETNLLIENEGN